MNIIVVGIGKIGFELVRALTKEGHSVTVIDRDEEHISIANSMLDAITVCGPVNIETLQLADVEKADLLVAVTRSDETNILCCMIAKKLGVPHTIARVRQREHYKEVVLLRDELGLSMMVNPEFLAAGEISRVLRFPSAAKVEAFAKGQAELVEFKLSEDNPLCGVQIRDYHNKFDRGTLICAVRRGGKVEIPPADFVLQANDTITVVGSPKAIHQLFRSMKKLKKSAKYVLVAGGGGIGFYLTRQLLGMGIHVKLLEQDPAKCEELKDELPKAEVVCCDASKPIELEEEGLQAMDAFVALTGSDEVNIITSAYAHSVGVEKIITKVKKDDLNALAASFGLDDPVQPRVITAQLVLQYVRAMENTNRVSGVETLRRIMDGALEVLEFRASAESSCVGKTLMQLPIRRDVLVAALIRDGKCIIPGGHDEIWAGDSVLAVTTHHGMTDLEDILKGIR